MARTRAQLLLEYDETHGLLVKPNQGWGSLAEPLWLPYSMGRKRGFYDVGTYVDKPLDHGGTDTHRGPPAWAYDLRRKWWVGLFGWAFRNAQRYANFLWENHLALDIEYIIVGRKIISRHQPTWQPYEKDHTHDWHIHVSGHWPGRA